MIKKIYWYLFVYDLNTSLEVTTSGKDRSLKEVWVQDLSYVVLFSYLFFIFSPVIPQAADLIAHTFWKEKHLQTAHHQYGKNHVGIEMLKVEKQAGKDKATNNQKTSLEDAFHMPGIKSGLSFPPERICKQAYCLFSYFIPFRFQDIDDPPPRL